MSTYRKLELLSIASTVVWTLLLVTSRYYTWGYQGNRFDFLYGGSELEIHESPPRPNEMPHSGSGWTATRAANSSSARSLKLPRTFRYSEDATGSIKLVRVIIPLWIPICVSVLASIIFRQLDPAKRIHFFASASSLWRDVRTEVRDSSKFSKRQLIRMLPLIACSIVALTLATLMLPLTAYPVFFQVSRPNNTIIYFAAYGSMLRLGTFSTPNQAMLHYDADSSRIFLRIIDRGDSHEMFRLQLPGAVDLMQNGMSLHDLIWRKPFPSLDGNLYQSQIRSWTGTPMIFFGLWPGIAFIRGPIRRYRRRSRGLCLQCGYNLAGNTSGVCPECGRITSSP